jgi:hypothetical protein
MSVDLNGSTQYLERLSAVITVYPATIVGYLNSNSATATQIMAALATAGSADSLGYAWAAGDVAGDSLRAGIYVGGVGDSANTTSGYSTSTWHHFICEFASSTSRTVWIDNGSSGTDTTSRGPATPDRTSIGRIYVGGIDSGYFNGLLAEIAFYSATLTATSRARLFAGWYPRYVQAADLVSYYPLPNVNDISDHWGANHMTAYGSPTTGASHPTMYKPPFTVTEIVHRFP